MRASRVAPREARRVVAEYGSLNNLPFNLLEDVLLCVSEAVSNVVFHAYRDVDSDGTVEIDAAIDSDLRICVRDRGSGFAFRDDSEGLGMGLPIITKLTRSFLIRTTASGGGTEVIMRFELPPA